MSYSDDSPNGRGAPRRADVAEEDELALEALSRVPMHDRVARLERRDLLEAPAAHGRVLAELGQLAREVRELRDERRRDNTGAKRTARLIATAIVAALASYGMPGSRSAPPPAPHVGAP